LNRIKQLREERGLSQQELGEKFNLTQQSIYKYEKGLSEPSIQTLKDFAVFFNTSVDYIVEFSDHPGTFNMESTASCTRAELQHLLKYRSLSAEHKRYIEYMCNFLVSEEKNS